MRSMQSQTELDEQFARNLMLEEQQQAEYQRSYRPDRNTGNVGGFGGGRHGQGTAHGSGAPGTGPGIEEQFNKFAESKCALQYLC